MTSKILAAVAAGSALVGIASAAQAREPYDELFFVRQHASAAELFDDRAQCRNAAQHMSDADAAYSNPEYGALSAMGSALDEDALHEGGLHKRLEQAVFMHCMEKKAWVAAAPFADVYFVRAAATAGALFTDRGQCTAEAFSMGSSAAAYSNPEYGAASAMGSALDEDALHEGGLHKRLQRAIMVDCMEHRGWTQLNPSPEDARSIGKATPRRPEALDAWLKAHEPPLPAAAKPKS